MRLTRLFFYSFVAVLAVFLLVPAVAIVLASFSGGPAISIPPTTWGIDNYVALFNSTRWGQAAWVSLAIAVPAGLISVAAALLVCLAATRSRLRFGGSLVSFAIVPLFVPGVALAVGLYGYFSSLHLIDNYFGMVMAHATLGLPLCVLVVWPAVREQPRDLELAAMTLGAGRGRAVFTIIVPAVVPALISAMLLSMLNSFDEATVAAFLTGPNTTTLPKAILDSVLTGLDPTITAISALLILVAAVFVFGSELAGKKGTVR